MGLTIAGLGVESGDLSVKAYKKIKQSDFVLVRTEKTSSVGVLKQNGIDYISLDSVYERSRNFDTLTRRLVKEVKSYLKLGKVAYLVDGAVSEDRCAKQLIKTVRNAEVFEGASKVGNALLKCGVSCDSYTAVSAYDIDKFERYTFPLVIYDLDSVILASEWKLKLFRIVGEETKVRLYIDKRVKTVALHEIDFEEKFDYSTVLIIEEEPLKDKKRFDFYDLMAILRILRAPNGCPWDRVQTRESIRKDLIEETYELIDAIDKHDDDKMKEETGDLLLQVAFYMLFAEESGAYAYDDVVSALCGKLVFRHTHIFGSDKASDAESALKIWNKNKQIEKAYESVYAYVDDVPKCLPALLRTEKVVKRAYSSNFDIYTDDEIKAMVKNILGEEHFEKNGGELLFLITYLLKRNGASPEENLADATKEFINKLKFVEERLTAEGLDIKTAPREKILDLLKGQAQ